MADVNANINIDINASAALAQLKALETQISNFNNSIARSNVAAAAAQKSLNDSFRAQIDATGQFNTSIRSMESNVSALGTAFDKGSLSAKQYFRYAASQMPGLANAFRGLGKEQAEMASLAENRVKQLQTRYVSLGRDINGMQKMLAIQPKTLAAGYATDIALAEQKQQLFNRALQLGSTGMVNWGKNTQWAGRQLMVGFTVPMTIAAGAAAKFFMDLEKSGVAFRRVYGDMDTTTQEAQKNLQAIQALGVEYTKYGLAVNEVIDIGARAAATGAMNDDLLAATEQTLRLATLGQTDYQTALDATISLQTAFGISSANLATTIDFLNAVENQTVLTLEDVARAVPRVAPVIKGLGGDVQDLAVFMTALREGGVSAEQGANALKSGLASLINPTARATETLKEMGINIKAIVDANRGDLMGTVRAFGQALESVSEFERQQALEATFGKYQYARLGALFKNIARDGSQAARAMELAGMSVEDLASLSEKELSVLSESVTNKFLGAVERLKVAIAPIGEMFLKVATPIIEVVTNIANKFNELPDTVKTVIAGIVGAIGLIAPAVLMGIGLIANGIGNGLKFILALRGGIKGLVAVLTGSSRNFQYQANSALDAAAAMSTLDGKTDALTGSLLMQDDAVRALAGAYGTLAGSARAAAASMPAAFPGVPVIGGRGRGAAPRRFARGGMVGGTGNQDTEPALLTPGEFVMNRQATERFGPILNAMNSGTIAGYAEGDRLRGMGSAAASHYAWAAPGRLSQSLLELDDLVGNLQVSMYDLTQASENQYEVTKRNARLSEIAGQELDVLAGGQSFAGTTMINSRERNAMFQAAGIAGEPFTISELQNFASTAENARDRIDSKFIPEIDNFSSEAAQWTRTLEESSDRTQTQIDFMKQQTESGLVLAKLQDKSAGNKLTADQAQIAASEKLAKIDTELARLRAQGMDDARLVTEAERMYKAALIQETKEMTAGPRGTGGGVLRDVATGRGAGSGLSQSARRRWSIRRIFGADEPAGTRKFAYGGRSAPASLREIQNQARELGVISTTSTAQGAQTASPSDATRRIGQDVANGLIQGMAEKTDDVKRQGNALGVASVQGVRDGSRTPGLSPAQTRGAVLLGEGATAPATQAGVPIAARPSVADDDQARVAAALARQEDEIDGATKQTKTMKDRIRGVSGKLFGVSAALTGLSIAGSFMEGQVGQVAQSIMPFAFALDGITGLLPMMMNPAGIVIAALAAVGGGLWFLNNQMNNVREEAQGFADALTTSAAEVTKVSEYFGNKSLVERQGLINVATSSGLKTKDVAAGMEFIGSEVGQEMAKEFSIALERQGGTQSAAAFANKLASMMMQGAIDFTQAKQMAAGLAQQLGQPEISAQIIGQLQRIVGPDGTDITRRPLQIAAEITANEQQIVSTLVDPTMNAISKAMAPDMADMAKIALVSPLAGLVTQLGIDIPYVTDISKNLISFLDEDFEKATASANAYGKAVGNSLRNAYDNLNSAIIRNDEIIENAKKKDRPELRQQALREEARLREQIATIQQTAEQNFAKLVQKNAALSKETLDGMEVSLKEIYQDPAMQMILDNLFDRTGGLDQEVRFDILMNLQSGALNPMAANSLFDLIGNDEQSAAVLNLMVEAKGLDKTNEFLVNNMMLGDPEVRRKYIIDFALESGAQGEQFLSMLGLGSEQETALQDSLDQAISQYEWAESRGFSGAELNTYAQAVRDAEAALRSFREERNRVLSDMELRRIDRDPALRADAARYEAQGAAWQSAAAAGRDKLNRQDISAGIDQGIESLKEFDTLAAEVMQNYDLVVESIRSKGIEINVDAKKTAKTDEELKGITNVLKEYDALPEDMQKTVNVDTLQATSNMEVFDINWSKINSKEDLQKQINILDGFSTPMQVFGMTYAQFAALPDIYKSIVIQYTIAVDQIVGRAKSGAESSRPDIVEGKIQDAAALAANPVIPEIDVPEVNGGGGTTDGGGGGGGGGEAAKSGADLVKEMIDGLKEQLKFLGDYKKVGDEVKSGLAQALRNAGAPEQLIADIIAKGADGIKMAKELLKDKAKKLKEVTDLMLEVTRLTFVESQRAEAANLATQTSAQIALANAGLNPAVVANMDPQQAQAVAAAYRAYQTAQRAADAAEDKSKKKRQEAARELAKARKEWEMVTDAVNKNTAAQDKNAIAQALLTAQQERQTAQNKVSAGLALAGRGFSAEQIGGMLEIEGAANQVVAYTNKIKELNNEKKRLEAKGEKNWTEEERKRYRQLERQLKKVNGDYRELLRLLGRITKEQTAVDVSSTITGMGARAVTARRQRTAQGLLMGQIPGLTYDQAESIAGDETTARAVVGSNRRVGAANRELTAAEKARDEYLAKGGKMKGEEWEEIKAKVAAARKEVKAATDEQKNLNAAIAGMVTEESALQWEGTVGAVTAEITKQQNAQKFLNMGISDQLVLSKLNGLSLEDQNYFLSLSVEEQQAFIDLLEQSIPLLDKINQSFEEIENRQRLISIQNRETADAKHGERDALEESAQLIDDAARAKQKEIDAAQDLIDIQQELNDDLQHQIDLIQRQVDLIQRQSDQLNRGLEIISQEEEKINEFYDDRLSALDKVEQANSRIAQQQQDQLNLAQALSSGDIYSAVGAAQQIRANQAQFAADQARQTLEEAREGALENITVSVNGQLMKRKDIEEQIRKNEEQIYQLNQSMLPLQDFIYANNLEIYRIQDTILEPLNAQLEAINKQREAIDENIKAWDRYYKYLEDNAVDPVTGIKFKDLAAIREEFNARMAEGVTNLATGEAYTEEEALTEAIAASGATLTPETIARLRTVLFRDDTSEIISSDNAAAAGEAAKKATPEVTKLKDEFVRVKDAIVALINPIKNSGKEVDKVVKDSITPLQESFKSAGNIVEGNNDSLLQKITNIKDFVVNSLIPEFSNLIVELNGATLAAQALQSALNAIERNITVTVTTQYVSAGAPQGAYKGGMIKGYAMGGSVFGSGSRDSVAAMLTPGEFVVRKSMVDKYGVPMLNKLNQGSLSPSYSVPNGNVNYRANTSNKSTVTTVAPVYNTYSVQINAETNASADEIANKAAMKIREMNNMSLRSARG